MAAELSSEEDSPLDALDDISTMGGLHHSSSDEEANTRATKRDIKSLLKIICNLLHADLSIIREDIYSLTDRVRVTEEETIEIKTKQVTLQESHAKMVQIQEGIEAILAEQDDKSYCKNKF
ncbi:Hypothetical predicted protein [Pelobates cultripes]|uniref:Uncharacterized protein n=1 Tax=Pelobates cultripes TaxID=61616 RepID=A0AAD1VZ73_PELCU|nr:Hypothetical predicted protein [Pelobates cultripes]